jgi:hypothetical protein
MQGAWQNSWNMFCTSDMLGAEEPEAEYWVVPDADVAANGNYQWGLLARR